ncbi:MULTISPECIES: hypothetical protein [unclassified Campylobacter]|uniref:hypothetical protein n=1 Tax=unclassified Campylobacter TaxID=2593542 RepID=UPI003D34802A
MSSPDIQKQKKALDKIAKFNNCAKQKALNSLKKLEKSMQLAMHDLQEYGAKENPHALLKVQELAEVRQICLEWIQSIDEAPRKTDDSLAKEHIKDEFSNFHRKYIKQILSFYVPSMHDEQFDFVYSGYLKEGFDLLNERFFELCDEYNEIEGE